MPEIPDYLRKMQEQEALRRERQRKLQEEQAAKKQAEEQSKQQVFAQQLEAEKRRLQKEAEFAAEKAQRQVETEKHRTAMANRPQAPQNPAAGRGGNGHGRGHGNAPNASRQATPNADKKPILFFLKDLQSKENPNQSSGVKQSNRDKLKLKKLLLPLLTLINENDKADKDKWKDDALISLKKRYDDLSAEAKKQFTGVDVDHDSKELIVGAVKKISQVLQEKFDKAYTEALVLVNSFRNFAMHKSTREDPFTSFSFSRTDGDLFTFFRLCAERERDSLIKSKRDNFSNAEDFSKFDHQIEYWNTILAQTPQLMKDQRGNIPFVYALAAIALFIEAKEMRELLTVARTSGFVSAWVLEFSIRGGFKAITPGVFQEDESLELHRLQIQRREELQQKIEATHKRVVESYKNFVGKDEPQKSTENYGFYYQKLLRYYSFSNSYPEIPEFENDIKTIVSQDLAQARLERIANIKKDNESGTAPKKQIPALETNPEIIKKGLTNIFRRGDTFLREAMAFLENHNSGWFGKNWRIVGNTVLYYKDYTPIEFDLRRKTRPSLNAASSVYKLRYDADKDGKIISLGRENLQALLASVLLGNTIDFKLLWATAAAPAEKPAKETVDNKKLWKDLAGKCSEWNRYKQAQLVLKYFRKFMPRMHVNESIAFHQQMMQSLYRLDNEPIQSKMELRNYFTLRGTSCPPEVEKLLGESTLLGLCKKCCQAFGELPVHKAGGNKTHKPIYMWSTHALHPGKKCSPKIKEALGWTEKQSVSLFDLLMKNAEAKSYSLPKVISLYEEKRSSSVTWPEITKVFKGKALRREQEIRSLLTEEFLFQEMAFHYVQKISGKAEHMLLLSTQKEGDKRSPTAFHILWELSPQIELSLEDFHKKDVKTALKWIFDPARITDNPKELKLNDRELAQRCLTAVCDANAGIKNHRVLASKAPEDLTIDYLDVIGIVNIAKRVLWLQKEMLYFICDMERHMIWKLSDNNALPEEAKDKNRNKLGYFEFSALGEKFHQLNPARYPAALFGQLIAARNMLAHGRLYNPENKEKGYAAISFSQVPDIIDRALRAMERKTLQEHYANNKNYKGK